MKVIDACPWCQSPDWKEIPSRFAMVDGVEQLTPAYNYCPDCGNRFNNPETHVIEEANDGPAAA